MFGIGNPQALLRPWRDIKQFSEELYAMLVSRAPVERDGPVTIRVGKDQTGLRLTRSPSEPPPPAVQPVGRPAAIESPLARRRAEVLPRGQGADRALAPAQDEPPASRPSLLSPSGPSSGPSPFSRDSRRREGSRGAEGERGRDGGKPAPDRRPLLEVEGPARFSGPDPVRFEEPPQVYDKKRHRWYTPPAFVLPDDPALNLPLGGTATATIFTGKVVSGTGNTYQVALYPNGPLDVAGDTVTATVPTIDPGETIDPGTWHYNVFQFADADGNPIYSFQPPVWIT